MKVLIMMDEQYSHVVYEAGEDRDDGYPEMYVPVEIPDALYEAYDNAYKALVAIRRFIVTEYDESPVNENYHEQMDAWRAANPLPSDDFEASDDFIGSDLEAAWEEYEKGQAT